MMFSLRAIRAGLGAAIVVSAILSPFASAAQTELCPTSLTTGNESSVTLVIPGESAAPGDCPTESTPLGSTGGSSSGSGATKSTTPPSVGIPAGTTKLNNTTNASDGSLQGAPRLTLDHDSVAPHQWILATGDGYTAAERVHFVLFPRAVDLGTFTADASGRITARFRIPADARPGAHTVEATGASSHYVRNAPITVVSASFAGTLPLRWWIGIVIGAVLLGMLALVLYFRRSIAGYFARSAPATGLVP
ncbi:MAG: hypothetical protein H7279_12095 [Microbacteriaceae bacterium]|nr:hypothetical protein [Microbacteriaceae bacterium]